MRVNVYVRDDKSDETMTIFIAAACLLLAVSHHLETVCTAALYVSLARLAGWNKHDRCLGSEVGSKSTSKRLTAMRPFQSGDDRFGAVDQVT